jgi:hypothetical protein
VQCWYSISNLDFAPENSRSALTVLHARALMESLGFAISHSRDGMNYYDDNSIQLDFFDDNVLHFIGFAHSSNFSVSYCDNDPFNCDARALFQRIVANEPTEIPFNEYDPFFPSQIISLWDAQEQYDYKGVVKLFPGRTK